MGIIRRILQRLRRRVWVNWMGEATEVNGPFFFCPGCRKTRSVAGAEAVTRRDGRIGTVCRTCIPITLDDLAELHAALDGLTSLNDL